MSKIETMRHLPTPADLRQSVLQIQRALDDSSYRLDATAKQVRDLEQLPQLVAEQVTEALRALDPILSMRQDVSRVLEAYDQVTEAQRSSLESMAKEISARTVASMETKAAGLDKTMQDLASQVTGLESTVASMEASSRGMQALPKRLSSAAQSAAEQMQGSSQELARAALEMLEMRPSVWLTLGQMLGAAILGALLVAAGQVGLNKILPPTETQANADWAASLWAKSSENEKKLLKQIVSRPGR